MRAVILGMLMAIAPGLASAQSALDPALLVDDRVITYYELDQRARLLEALGTPGDTRATAQEQLIEDRLKLTEVGRVGLSLTPEEQQEAMAEFATRANLTLPQFLQALGQQGVDAATLRDLTTVGTLWRDYIRARYGRDGQVSEQEIDRALAGSGGSGSDGIRVLISEIIMVAPPGAQGDAARARAEQISRITDPGAFSAQARQVSALPTRANGGRLDWMMLSELPPGLAPIILGLSVGEVAGPLPIPNAIALFQLRGIEEVSTPTPAPAALEYATVYLPGGLTQDTLREAALLDARTDTCDDLYGEFRGSAQSALERQSLPPAQIPTDIGFELSKLDAGETSAVLTRNNGDVLVFLMLCSRTSALAESGEVDREAVRNQIRSRRLNGLAEALLAELRAAADIRRP